MHTRNFNTYIRLRQCIHLLLVWKDNLVHRLEGRLINIICLLINKNGAKNKKYDT